VAAYAGGHAAGYPRAVASCLCRVAQEALHNVLKHARTGNVRLNQTKGEWRLPWHSSSIYDRGVGFDSADWLTPLWHGNRKHEERAFLALGEFSIHSRPGQGTEVRVFVALPKEALGSQLSSIQHRLQPDNVSSTPLKKP